MGTVSELSRIAASASAGSAQARVALGPGTASERLTAAMRALVEHRGPGKSACPSDAARAVGGERWRDLMDEARAVARALARSGEVVITARGVVVDPDAPWRGPVRVRRAPR